MWGRLFLIGGGVGWLFALAIVTGAALRIPVVYAPLAFWGGLIAGLTGVVLLALGAIEQRLIEQRELMKAVIRQGKANASDRPQRYGAVRKSATVTRLSG